MYKCCAKTSVIPVIANITITVTINDRVFPLVLQLQFGISVIVFNVLIIISVL